MSSKTLWATVMSASAVVLSAISIASVLSAPTSHADPSANDKFLSCLANNNITYSDRDKMLDLGRRIQVDLRNGVADSVIVRNLVVNYDVQLSIAKIDVACVESTMVSNGETVDWTRHSDLRHPPAGHGVASLPPADGSMWTGIIV